MPSILTTYVVETHETPNAIPEHVWTSLRANPCNSNIILPHAEAAKSRAGTDGASAAELWISCSSLAAGSSPTVDFVLSCTSNHLGQYPIFIFTTLSPSEQRSGDVIPRLTSLANALLRSVPVQRVFSVFAPEAITSIFASIWTDITGVGLETHDDAEYYSAKLSYCTQRSFKPRRQSILPDIQYELRLANEKDLLAAANLCYGFALESHPFVLDTQHAIREASHLIKNRQLWVHEVRLPERPVEIASIVAVTRTSSTVSGITKVYTNPQWRGQGCAERLVRHVTKHLLKTKERVVLYIAHNNPAAAKVYHRVGFLGLGPDSEPVEGVDRWLELGFDRSQVILGHW